MARDNLPLDGIVLLDGYLRVQYRGYHVAEFNKCAVREVGKTDMDWVDRSRLSRIKDKA
jgi:hypothetical protein